MSTNNSFHPDTVALAAELGRLGHSASPSWLGGNIEGVTVSLTMLASPDRFYVIVSDNPDPGGLPWLLGLYDHEDECDALAEAEADCLLAVGEAIDNLADTWKAEGR